MGLPEEVENVPKTMQYDPELNGGAIRTIEIAVQFRNVLNGVPSNLEQKCIIQLKKHNAGSTQGYLWVMSKTMQYDSELNGVQFGL